MQAVFYVLGGTVWMLGYSLGLPLLRDDEAKVEATRLLNLMTQVGILAGIMISMLVMSLIESAIQHKAGTHGSGSNADAGLMLDGLHDGR